MSFRATVAAGNPWSANQLQERFSLTRAQAAKLRCVTSHEFGESIPVLAPQGMA